MDSEAIYTEMAQQALVAYGLRGSGFRVVKSTNNVVFQVTAGKDRYALRLHRPGYRQLRWIEGELEWLDALHANTDLCVPKPAAPIFHGRVGEQERYCTLLTWLDGAQVLPAQTTEQQAYSAGEFIGRLHQHSAPMTWLRHKLPPLDIEARLMDRSTFRQAGGDLLGDDGDRVLDQAIQRIRIVIQNPTSTQDLSSKPIHGDLIWKNLIFQTNAACAIDFDDCAYGSPLYDLAPLLLGYLDEPNYPALRAAVWAGYTSIQPNAAPHETELEPFLAARYALSIEWIAANRHNPAVADRYREIIASRIQRLKLYLETGELKRGDIII